MTTVTEQRADTPVCESLGSPVTPALTPVSGRPKSALFNSLLIVFPTAVFLFVTGFLFLLLVFLCEK